MADPDPIRKKLVIVGDGAAGKTSLLIVFTSGHFPVNYIPTVFDNHLVDVFLDNEVVQLALWDTAGQEDYARLRPLSYPNSDCILLCFAVDKPKSLENIPEKWLPELKQYCPTAPFLLIGCKTDLRNDPETAAILTSQGQTFVTYHQGVHMAKQIGAWRYMECSAKLNEGVGDVFEFATRAALWGTQTGGTAPTATQGGQSNGRQSSSQQSVSQKGKKKGCVMM
ncbi:P-loop containing nucleoside triphosphate hydrolase protein [Obelidium mucronatum]|nr:P-loop containing nucleoside triphosphate hydrolase protein [Obelidium mucronatum]